MPRTLTTLGESPAPFTSARNDGSKAPNTAALTNANQRTNLALNSHAWDAIPHLNQADRDELFWFHDYCLQQKLPQAKIGELLGGYDRTNAARILAGSYHVGAEAWAGIIATIRDLRESLAPKPTIGGIAHEPTYVPAENDILWQGVGWAAQGGFSLLVGESGAGKTRTITEWDLRNPGRMIRVNVPPIGGVAALVKAIADRMGLGIKRGAPDTLILIKRNLSPRNLLVCDQAHLLLPETAHPQSKSLETLMNINEEGIGIILPLTRRNAQAMGNMRFQIEQVLGRAEAFVAAPPTRQQVGQIAGQFGKFSQTTISELWKLAKRPGGFRNIIRLLDAAERVAKSLNRPADDQLVAAAIENRLQRMGGTEIFADKAA